MKRALLCVLISLMVGMGFCVVYLLLPPRVKVTYRMCQELQRQRAVNRMSSTARQCSGRDMLYTSEGGFIAVERNDPTCVACVNFKETSKEIESRMSVDQIVRDVEAKVRAEHPELYPTPYPTPLQSLW